MSRTLKPLNHRRGGFTAIEFALIVAATSIVAALGVSMYQTYSARAQVATSIDGASATQRLVVAAFEHKGIPPLDTVATGIDNTARSLLLGEYISSFEVYDGRIDLVFGANAHPAIAGKVLSLTPFETADQDVVWICGNQPSGVGLEPLGFAGGARRAVQVPTQIEDRYLPSSCR
jgi:type IV pilus assembly protein PilA